MTMPQTILVGRTLKNRYEIQEPLGAGGMGAVFVATDRDLSRSVVVKVPHATFLSQPGFLVRFQKEIASLLKLEHKNVVKVLDAGTTPEGEPYLVLQHLKGGSLDERLTGTATCDEVLAWLPQVADALDFIHGRGYVHRDIKPANILFDDQDDPYVADFGITKALGDANTMLTAPGFTPGTPNYMAPEAESADPLTGAYDQYALAVVVYQALSGVFPHKGTTPYEVLNAKKTQKPVPLEQVAPQLSAAVTRAVMVALDREPRGRHSSCKAFAAALGEAHRSRQASSGLRSQALRALAAVGVIVAALIVVWWRASGDEEVAAGPNSGGDVPNGSTHGVTKTGGGGGGGVSGTGDDPTGDDPTGDDPTGDDPTGDDPTGDQTGDQTGDVPGTEEPNEVPLAVPWDALTDALELFLDVTVDVQPPDGVDLEALRKRARARWVSQLTAPGVAVRLDPTATLVLRAHYSLRANEVLGSWMGLGGASVSVLSGGVTLPGWGEDEVDANDMDRKWPGSSAAEAASGVLTQLVDSGVEAWVHGEREASLPLRRQLEVQLPEGADSRALQSKLEAVPGILGVEARGQRLVVTLRRGSLSAFGQALRSSSPGQREFELASWDASTGRLVLRLASQ